MRKLLWLFLALPLAAFSQISNPSVQYVSVAPSGACSASPPVQVVNSTGAMYTCNNGTWGTIGGGGTGAPADFTVVLNVASPTFAATSNTSDSFFLNSTFNVSTSNLSGASVGELLAFTVCPNAHTFTWPASFVNFPNISGSGTCTTQSGYYDGTNVNATPFPGGTSSGGGTYVNVTAYGAVPDASTNNKAAFTAAMVAVNAITTGTPTLYLPCTSAGCQYNCNDAGSQCLSLTNTNGVSMKCDQNVIINDTGSAHIVNVLDGSSIYTDFSPMTIDGCYFKSTGATAAIYVHPGTGHMETLNVRHNHFTLPTASTAILGDGGSVYIANIDYNIFSPPALAGGNFVDLGLGDGIDNMIYAHHNQIYCGRDLLACTAGFGIRVYGIGSDVSNNVIADMRPDIQCMVGNASGHGCSNSVFSNNNLEVSYSGTNAIQFGSPGDGGYYIDGVKIIDNFIDMHNTTANAVGMGSTTDLLWGNIVRGNTIVDTSYPVIALNNLDQQQDNIADANMCAPGTTPTDIHGVSRCPFPIHQTVGNDITFEPWLEEDNRTYADTFNTDGNLTAPYFNTGGTLPGIFNVASHVLSRTGTGTAHSSYDLPANQLVQIQLGTIPSSGGYVEVDSRYTRGISSGTNMMYCFYTTGTGTKLGKIVGGVSTQLGSTYTTTNPVTGDWLALEDIGTLHQCYIVHNGARVLAVSAVDSSVTVGYGGFDISVTATYGTTITAFTEQGLP